MAVPLRQRRRELLREEILEATHLLMAERGYAAMSMDELAARVGVSKPTLYNQFPTKEDLVAAMAAQLLERVFADVAGAEPGQSPLARLCGLLHAIVRIQVERRAAAMQLWMPEIIEILERSPATREHLLNVDRVVVGLVGEAVAAGEIDPAADVASVVRVFFALVCAPSLGRHSCVPPADPARMADTVVAIFRGGVTAPASPGPAPRTPG
jgi:AcrR family transcriptional regulator